jgi:hypothetical protein
MAKVKLTILEPLIYVLTQIIFISVATKTITYWWYSGPPSTKGPRLSKWGRLLGSSSVHSASDTNTKVAVARSLSARASLRETAQGRASSSSSSYGGQGNKMSL